MASNFKDSKLIYIGKKLTFCKNFTLKARKSGKITGTMAIKYFVFLFDKNCTKIQIFLVKDKPGPVLNIFFSSSKNDLGGGRCVVGRMGPRSTLVEWAIKEIVALWSNDHPFGMAHMRDHSKYNQPKPYFYFLAALYWDVEAVPSEIILKIESPNLSVI